MGGGTKPEHLLFILPFPEPTEIFERIKRNHPHIKITYQNLRFVKFENGLKKVPRGLDVQAAIHALITPLR